MKQQRDISPPLADRINDGLKRIAAVMRADEWGAAQALGLNPTQLQILGYLDGRPQNARVTELASHLGVSQPTATDSINALHRKGYVSKAMGADRRAASIGITAMGRKALRAAGQSENATQEALAALPPHEQQDLLISLVKVISTLQQAGAIPLQRMCSTCRYFEPHRHAGKKAPHHCHFMNAPLRRQDFRVDCHEHETAEPDIQAANWAAFSLPDRPLRQ